MLLEKGGCRNVVDPEIEAKAGKVFVNPTEEFSKHVPEDEFEWHHLPKFVAMKLNEAGVIVFGKWEREE